MNQNGGSLTDTLVKLVLIFFISLLSFSVGTFVGKQFADGQHKYTSLESDFNAHRETASVQEGTDVKSEEALTDEDIANLTEEFVKTEKQKGKDIMKHQLVHKEEGKEAGKEAEVAGHDKHEKAEKHEKQVAHEPEAERSIKVVATARKGTANHKEPSATHKEEAAAEHVAKGEAPTAAPAPETRAPSSLPVATTTSVIGKFTVQVAAYANEGEAKKRVQSLKEKGFSAFTVTAQKNGKNWYRVGIGLYNNMKDATSAREDLAKQDELKDSFVQKIIQ